MSWYRVGSVVVTPGSTTVTGVSTAFVANCRVGDAFIAPNGAVHEITNIASDTALSIYPAYGSTAAYSIGPMQGYDKLLADKAGAILQQWGSTLAGLGDVASQDIVPVAMGGTGGVTPAAARTGLGLKSAAVADALGTVAQAGGVPTGALMERGSNANGTYEKFACGTLICRMSLALNRTLSVARDGAFAASTAEAGRTFPASFSSTPAISIEVGGLAGPTFVGYQDTAYFDAPYAAWPAFLIYGTNQRGAAWYTICLTAIGRWFG